MSGTSDDRRWAEEVVDATHPELGRLHRWALAVARGATVGALSATLVGAIVAPHRLANGRGMLLAAYLIVGLGSLWLLAWVAGRTVAQIRLQLVQIVTAESRVRGRAAALAMAARLGVLAPAEEPAPTEEPAAVAAPARAYRRGPERAMRAAAVTSSAGVAGRRAIAALLALSTLGGTGLGEATVDEQGRRAV